MNEQDEEKDFCIIPGSSFLHGSGSVRLYLHKALPIDIADFIADQPTEEQQLVLFNSLPEESEVSTFEYLPSRIQKMILQTLPPKREAFLLNALSPDDRTALLQDLPTEDVNKLLKYLSPQERALAVKLLGYPKDSVGRLMTPDYIAVKMQWTVQQTLEYIRECGHDSETLNVIYAVDDNGILIDDFRIRELLLAPLDMRLENIADHKYVALNVADDVEEAIRIFRKYARTAMPVIDPNRVLLGIVTSDDIMSASVAEDTEDIQKFGGVEALKEPYSTAPIQILIRKRASWLIVLFIGELFTASAMGYFADELAKAVVLALFLPLIISSGGNAGSQASTLIIRAMALGEITLKDWWKVMRREILSGLALGIILGAIGFIRVVAWGGYFHLYGEHYWIVALTIFLSLIGVVMWGSLSGSMMPLILYRLGFDPATSSAPFVATLADVTGLVIYFTIAIWVLQGTLL